MEPTAAITWGLVGTISASVTVAVIVVLWITGKFAKLREALTDEIQKSRSDGDKKIAVVHQRVTDLIARLQKHELDDANNYIKKDDIAADFNRVISSIDQLRTVIEGLGERLAHLEP